MHNNTNMNTSVRKCVQFYVELSVHHSLKPVMTCLLVVQVTDLRGGTDKRALAMIVPSGDRCCSWWTSWWTSCQKMWHWMYLACFHQAYTKEVVWLFSTEVVTLNHITISLCASAKRWWHRFNPCLALYTGLVHVQQWHCNNLDTVDGGLFFFWCSFNDGSYIRGNFNQGVLF